MKKFTIGLSTTYFGARDFKIYDSVKKAHQMGFKWVEMGAGHGYEAGAFETLKKIKKDFPQINFSIHAYFPPCFKEAFLSNTGNGLTSENQEVIQNAIRSAEILEAKIISFHVGFNAIFSKKRSSKFKTFPGFRKFYPEKIISSKEAFKNMIEFFDHVFKKLKDKKIKVAIENCYIPPEALEGLKYKMVLKTPQEFKDFIDQFPRLSFLFDQGHAFINRQKSEDFLILEDKIAEMHLSGVDQDFRDHRSVGPDRLNTAELLDFLEKINIPIPLIFENAGGVTEEEILAQRQFLEDFLIDKGIEFE